MLCKDLKMCADETPINACYCLDKKTGFREYARGWMFDSILSDKTGKIDLVYFGANDKSEVSAVYQGLITGHIFNVNGILSSYRDNKQIIVDGKDATKFIRLAGEGEYDLSQFLHETNQDIDEMWSYLSRVIDTVENEHIKNLLRLFIGDETFVELFKVVPGARLYHHACKGGLLEHVWETMQYCEIVTHVHPSLNRDLIMAGAFLHDIGKMRENVIARNIRETREGMLLGHVYLGANMVKSKLDELPEFPELLEYKLMHILLSHHGEFAHGSAVEPRTPEAVAVSTADVMGSLVTQFIRAREDAAGDDFKTWKDPIGWVFKQ